LSPPLPRHNYSQQPTTCRSLVRRFRALFFAGPRVSPAGTWRHVAAEWKNVGPPERHSLLSERRRLRGRGSHFAL